MAAKINKNRYRLITLLYIVFVCLSVLNIPTSLLDGNEYVIKTYEFQERNKYKEVVFANQIIEQERPNYKNKDSIVLYTNLKNRIHGVYQTIDSVDNQILSKLKNEGSSIEKDFNSRRRIESYLLKDSLLSVIRKSLFTFATDIRNNPNLYDSSIITLYPIVSIIKNHNGKEIEWDQFLFLHKPIAISYLQIKRLKVLLLDQELIYQTQILKQYGIEAAYYSNRNKKSFVKREKNSSNSNFSKSKEIQDLQSPKISKLDVNTNSNNSNKIDSSNQQLNNAKQNVALKEKILESVLNGLKIDKLYVGVPNLLLSNFNYQYGKEFKITFAPNGSLTTENNNVSVVFQSQGSYLLKFTYLLNNSNIVIFEKELKVYNLPNPNVYLNIRTNQNGLITSREIGAASRLIPAFSNLNFDQFPGRINGYRFYKYALNGSQETLYNYGETFQSPLLTLIGNVKKGEIIVFDNITISLNDGTTRTVSPLIYKIID
jgi:hypothetical protein